MSRQSTIHTDEELNSRRTEAMASAPNDRINMIGNVADYNDDDDNDVDEVDDGALLRDMLNDSEFVLNFDPHSHCTIHYCRHANSNHHLAKRNIEERPEAADTQCWVCFATCEDDGDAATRWVHPCRCHGTTKWVHQWCIQRWIDEKQRGNTTIPVECPQCGTTYRVEYPVTSAAWAWLNQFEVAIQRVCPFMTSGIAIASLYWTCVTYGAVTVMQIMGSRRGLALFSRTDPVIMLATLPLLPVGLVMARLVKWQDPVLRAIRHYGPKVALVHHLMPTFAYDPLRDAESVRFQASPGGNAVVSSRSAESHQQQPSSSAIAAPNNGYPVSQTTEPAGIMRTLCGAIALPTIAVSVGNALYINVIDSPPERVIAGGLTYLVVKGVVKLYYRQHLYVRQCKRYVANYCDRQGSRRLSR